MERRYFEHMPVAVRSEGGGEENPAPIVLDCRFATFVGTYECGYDCYERIDLHAFDDTIADDIRILWNHDTGLVLGRTAAGTADLKIMPEGVDGTVEINQDDRAAMDAAARVKRGDVTGCSIGFDILDEHIETRDGKTGFVIDKIKLYECSICTFPAYEATSAKSRSAGAACIKAFKFRMKERLKNA